MTSTVTGFDIARLAGVSQATVSRALRNLPGTAPETRQRVLDAAASLSYVPSASGRALSSRRTRRVAIVSQALTNPYYPHLVDALRERLGAADYRTALVTEDAAGSIGADQLADGSYDGVVLTTTDRRSSLPRDLTERGVPHVLSTRLLDEPESSGCEFDNEAGSDLVAELLVGLGHTRIASVQGPVEASTGRLRALGLSRGLRRRGVRLRREHVRRVGFDHEGGRRAAAALLDRHDPPTAVVCGNDVIALGVLSAAADAGVRVPEDLTVVGFDDIPMAGWPLIGLTTVTCDLRRLAAETVELLLRHVEDADAPIAVRRLPVRLTLRSTHGPARVTPG